MTICLVFGHPCLTLEMFFDGLCIYAYPCLDRYPSIRRVLNGFSSTGDKNMTIENCENICKGLKASVLDNINYIYMTIIILLIF